MSVEVIRCPACNGTLDYDGKSEFIKCSHCGNTLRLTFKNNPVEPSFMRFMDKDLNIPLASCGLPDTYKSVGSLMPANAASFAYPMPISCNAYNQYGTVFTFYTGESHTDDTKCPMISGPYATVVNQISKASFVPFMDAEKYANYYINQIIQGAKMTNAYFIENRSFPATGYSRQQTLNSYIKLIDLETQRSGTGPAPGRMYYVEESCKIYEVDVGQVKMRIAVAFILKATRYQMPNQYTMSNVLGGIFGQRRSVKSNGAAPGTFGDIPNNGIIEWAVDGLFSMMCLKERFDTDYKDFEKFASTFRIDPYINSESFKKQEQMRLDVAHYTQQNIAQQQANFQAMQQANRALQEAYDSANQAWWNRSNAHHAQVMSSSVSTFGESSSDRISRMQSEAIRGVNTYVREDGTQVEVSVDYDHVYSNNLGDTLATNSNFEPGGNWQNTTKI